LYASPANPFLSFPFLSFPFLSFPFLAFHLFFLTLVYCRVVLLCLVAIPREQSFVGLFDILVLSVGAILLVYQAADGLEVNFPQNVRIPPLFHSSILMTIWLWSSGE